MDPTKVRGLWFLPFSGLVVFALFSFMAQLAGFGLTHNYNQHKPISIEIGRIKFDSELNVRERLRIPPPTIEQPPAPHPQASTQRQSLNVSMPDVPLASAPLDLDIKINIGSNIAELSASDLKLSNDLDLNLSQVPSTRINPIYPRRALKNGIEGDVTAEFTVNADGRVVPDSLKIVDASPPGVFDNAVRRAILRWRFNPLVQNGKAQSFKTRQKLSFKMQS